MYVFVESFSLKIIRRNAGKITQGSTMNEQWKSIEAFPDYKVSDLGRVYSERLERILTQSPTLQGALTVGLFRDGHQHRRSVKRLVAEAFVEGGTVIFNTPIHLDANQENVEASNLVWRPRWFATSYSRQFKNIEDRYRMGPIINLDTNVEYYNIVEGARRLGLLFYDVWYSIHTGTRVFPHWERFDWSSYPEHKY